MRWEIEKEAYLEIRELDLPNESHSTQFEFFLKRRNWREHFGRGNCRWVKRKCQENSKIVNLQCIK